MSELEDAMAEDEAKKRAALRAAQGSSANQDAATGRADAMTSGSGSDPYGVKPPPKPTGPDYSPSRDSFPSKDSSPAPSVSSRAQSNQIGQASEKDVPAAWRKKLGIPPKPQYSQKPGWADRDK